MRKEAKIGKSDMTDIFLLTGFLGSGKTTLLNRVLSWDADLSDTVVLVNEFGKIGIDGAIIKNKSKGREVIELTSGCICCTLTDELVETLEDIWQQFRPKRILLEATGVAEPGSITDIIASDTLRDRMKIEKKITVLGIKYWLGREAYGPFFINQVEQADLILLNKIDTVSKERLQKAVTDLKAHVPDCPVLPTLHCEVDPEVFWNRPSAMRLGNFYTSMPSSAIEMAVEKDTPLNRKRIVFDTFDFVSERPLDEDLFDQFLKGLPWQLFRIKGPVRFSDRTVLLNHVSGQSDWQEWEEKDHTRLAFIGFDIDAGDILSQLEKCLTMGQGSISLC
jgi:G3E family GTPase